MKKALFTLTLLMGLPLMAGAQQTPDYDWAQFGRYSADNAQCCGKAPVAVIMGDSITDGWLQQDPAFFKDNNIAGRGISGQVTSQMLVRFRRDVLDLHPRYVVIVAGINDIARNNGYIAEENILGNIESMCELAALHGIIPVLTTLFPAGKIGWRPGITDALEQVKSFNEKIRAYARTNGLECIDFEPLMADENGITSSELCTDGIHPTLNGYKVLEEAVLKVLK